MRILMIGTTSIRYVRENWLEPMRKMYDLTYIPYDTLFRAMGIERLNRYIADMCKKGFDYVFFYPDGRGQMFSNELFEMIKDERKIVFHSDDAGGLWFRNCSRHDYRFDFVASSSKEGYTKRTESKEYKGNACYIPWGYNDEIYFKTSGEKKDTDVVFLGSNFEKNGEYILDGKFRQALLTHLYEAGKKRGFSLKIYGAGWDRHPVLRDCYAGFAEASEINNILNRARIILGMGYTIDEHPTYQTKLKHFEFSGTGSFQLVNENPELEEIFGDSLGYFTDADDMVEKVVYYLDNPEEREEKANRAYRICREECTIFSRIDELFNKAGEYFNYVPHEKKRNEITIDRIKMKDSGKEISNTCDYISFADDIMCFDYNDSAIYVCVRDGETLPPVLSLYSYVSYCDKSELEDSKIIRRSAGPDTELIPPVFKADDLIYFNEIRNSFMCFEENGRYYPIDNYLFRRDIAEDILDELKRGNHTGLKEAKCIKTICGDYIIPENDFVKRRYFEYFERVLNNNNCVVIYGLDGYIFNIWEEWVHKNGLPDNVLYADKNQAGKKKDGITCIDPGTLLNGSISPSVILITAVFAGEEIARFLKPTSDKVKIVKMYDMNTYRS